MIGPLGALQQTGSVKRPAIITVSFFLLFVLLDTAARLFETFPKISLCYLPAGLSLALVLICGLHYAVLIALAHLVTDVWIRPMPTDLGDTAIYAFAIGATYLGAAVVLSRVFGRSRGVQSRSSLAIFLLGGVLISICFSVVTALHLWATGIIGWQQLPNVLTHGSIGSLLGIYSVAPFLILMVAPHIQTLLVGSSEETMDGLVDSNSSEGARLALFGIGGGFALFGLVIILVVMLNIDETFLVFCLLLPPFLGVALLAGLEVFTAAAFGAVLSSSIMQWDLHFELQQTVDFHALVLLVVLNGMLIGTIVSEKKLLQGTDSFREGVLDSVSFAAQRLAGVENWATYFAEVLRQFGEASRCSYVCLFEAWPLENEHTFELLPHDWSSPKYKLDQGQLALLNRIRSREITRNIHRLGNGEVWRDPPASSTREEKAVWTASGIRFTLVMPVRVDRELWGCVVLGRAEDQEDWTRREMGTVCNAMRTLGSLLASARTTEQIQQLSENIRGDLWISSPDGHRRIGLSPRGDALDSGDIARLPDSWMDAVHADDISAVEEALSGRGDFDMEYRIILADRSVRWVRDRGFVVRNEMGRVSRVIGMTEDVTAQKNVEAELEQSVDLLAALFDKMGSGILVEDQEMRICHVNKDFFDLLDIDSPPGSVAGSTSGQLFSRSKVSARRIEKIRNSAVPVIDEELDLDGSVLKFTYVPFSISRMRRYHLWQFREVQQEQPSNGEDVSEGSLTAKDQVLRNTYEAIRKDLQVIYGVLKLQSNRVRDEHARSYFAADQTRVMAIALVHERLSKSAELGVVDFPGYARNLTDQLVRAYLPDSQDVQVKFDVAALPMAIGMAIPCGLIINELVTNSLRYAFPDNRQGEISIRFGQLDGHTLRLTVGDNGVGFPEGLDFKNTSTLGLMLVTGLTEQLGGTVTMRNHTGTEFNISFPSNGNSPVPASIPAATQTSPSHQTQTVS